MYTELEAEVAKEIRPQVSAHKSSGVGMLISLRETERGPRGRIPAGSGVACQ